MKRPRKFKFRSGFSIGNIVAEFDDDFLGNCFVEIDAYGVAQNPDVNKCFFIGRTGSGKSAILLKLESLKKEIIRINPEDLSLRYLSNFSLIRHCHDAEIRLDLFYKLLWKHIIVVEILKTKFSIIDSESKKSFLSNLFSRKKYSREQQEAFDYLDEWGDKFWIDTQSRIRQLTENFEKHVSAKMGTKLVGAEAGAKLTQSIVRVFKDEIQELVNSTQINKLNKVIKLLNSDILDDSMNKYYVIIDDLDRDWVSSKYTISLIRCLFESVQDLIRDVKNLKFIISLRTNIFEQLDYESQPRVQGEKHRALVENITWNKEQLYKLIDNRVRYLTKKNNYGREIMLGELMLGKTRKFDPFEYILKRTQHRPRDIIKYFNICIKNSIDKAKLEKKIIMDSENEYSIDALKSLADEWKDPYIDINMIYEKFNATNMPLMKEELKRVIDEIILLSANRKYKGNAWLEGITNYCIEKKGEIDEEAYISIIELLLRMGFIGIKYSNESKIEYMGDLKLISISKRKIEEIRLYIHPAYRKALKINDKRNN